MTNNNTRRNFVVKSALITGTVLLPGWITGVRGGDKNKANTCISGKPKVIDKEVWFVNNAANKKDYRPAPADPHFHYVSNVPVINPVQPVSFPWGHENFYGQTGVYLTDNVYCEPGKPWVLQLFNSTPGQGDTATGSPQYKIWYRTSLNGGKTFSDLKQVIVKGHTSINPIENVEIGRNGFNVDFTRPIVRASNGELLIPVGLHPWDTENKKIYLPVSGAFLFQDTGVLIANWLPDGSDVEWNFGKWLRIDHNLSTRGLSEPTIVETRKPGRFALIARGSNMSREELPGYAWVSFSDDYCRTWSAPKPFTYTDGGNFFVPASHSTLIKSEKSGRVYWIGNLNTSNTNGSHPRYPIAIGEVDIENFGLIRDTVTIIDSRYPEVEDQQVQLSNFKVAEYADKEQLLIVCTRREGRQVASHPSWYRIQL